jgi:hypothetical protein
MIFHTSFSYIPVFSNPVIQIGPNHTLFSALLILLEVPIMREWINEFCDARVDENEHIYSMRWLARSADGSRFLQIYTIVSSDDQEDCLHDQHCPHCHTPAAHPSVVHCGRPLCTYASGFDCLVFSMDTSLIQVIHGKGSLTLEHILFSLD